MIIIKIVLVVISTDISNSTYFISFEYSLKNTIIFNMLLKHLNFFKTMIYMLNKFSLFEMLFFKKLKNLYY